MTRIIKFANSGISDYMKETSMREMSKAERKKIKSEAFEILQNVIGSEYAGAIIEQYDEFSGCTFIEQVILYVMETSSWKNEGVYSDNDVRLAIGRELVERLGC